VWQRLSNYDFEKADLLAVAQGLYAFNRFLASGLMMLKPFKPRYMLLAYLFGAFIFSIAAMNTSGTTSIALLIMVFCFESVRFLLIHGSTKLIHHHSAVLRPFSP
jgi:FHS family L-fucose permease-like MFS transporter